MKKLLALILVIGVILFSYRFFSGSGETSEVVENETIPAHSVPARRAEEKRLYQAPRPTAIPQELALSPQCKAFWEDLLAVDLSDASYFHDKARLPEFAGCSVPKEFAEVQKNFEKDCVAKVNEKISNDDLQKCWSAMFYYRAYVDDYLTRDLRPDQISDPKILIDKVFARFLADPELAADYAERLADLQPDNHGAQQAHLVSRLVTEMRKSEMSPEAIEKLTRLTQRARETNPDDPQNDEIELLMTTKGDPVAGKRKAEELYRQHPDSATHAYYLSKHEYKSGNPEKGWALIQRAQQLAPGNQIIKGTMDRIKKDPGFYKRTDANSQVFETQFGFTLKPDAQ